MTNIIQQHIDLFARDMSSKIKHWTCITTKEWIDGNEVGKIEVRYGVINGKRATKVTLVTHGLNIGKSNETTPFTQALRDTEGKILHKKREGYKDLHDLSIDSGLFYSCLNEDSNTVTDEFVTLINNRLPTSNTDLEGNVKPMKAQPYFKDDGITPRISFPCYAQPKINGFRCFSLFRLGETSLFGQQLTPVFLSKNGLNFIPFPLIEKDLTTLYNAIDDEEKDTYIFDGEMYIPNQSLQTISSAVRKRNALTDSLEYHIFDLAIPHLTQKERTQRLKETFDKVKQLGIELAYIKFVPTITIHNHREAVIYKNNCIDVNYEGAIFRDLNAKYQFGKRPKTMTKFKDKDSQEFIIVNIIDTETNPGVPVFTCKNDLNEELFDVVIEGKLEDRKKYFTNKEKYIGKLLTVEFYERTKRDVPFHAVGITIRDYE